MKYYLFVLMFFLSLCGIGQIKMTHIGPSDKPLYNIVLIEKNDSIESNRESFVSTIVLTPKRYEKVNSLLLNYKNNKLLDDNVQYNFGSFWIQLEDINVDYVIDSAEKTIYIFEQIISSMELDGEEKLSSELQKTIRRIGH